MGKREIVLVMRDPSAPDRGAEDAFCREIVAIVERYGFDARIVDYTARDNDAVLWVAHGDAARALPQAPSGVATVAINSNADSRYFNLSNPSDAFARSQGRPGPNQNSLSFSQRNELESILRKTDHQKGASDADHPSQEGEDTPTGRKYPPTSALSSATKKATQTPRFPHTRVARGPKTMGFGGLAKDAALGDEVSLQPHQQRIADESSDGKIRKLLVHGLGSGKTLSAISAAEAAGDPYVAVAPASVRPQFRREISRFTDRKTPSEVISYEEALKRKGGMGGAKTLIVDEAHNLRNPFSRRSKAVASAADKADRLLLLSGSPVVNRPGDFASMYRMLTGRPMSPQQFESRYIDQSPIYPTEAHRIAKAPTGWNSAAKNTDELHRDLAGKVDWHQPGKSKIKVDRKDIEVEMSPLQQQVYRAIWGQTPPDIRWKLQYGVDLTDDELKKMQAFLSGPRQVGLSVLPYMNPADPYKAFELSSKLQLAHKNLAERLQKDPAAKAIVFSNFIEAGLNPYAEALKRNNTPHAVFHGGLTDQQRREIVDQYNRDKLRVLLLGPSGTEGLSLRGTRLVQLLDPHWHPTREEQSIGRAIRYDSHNHLPEDQRQVDVERYITSMPVSTLDRVLGGRTALSGTDSRLTDVSKHKKSVNQVMLDVLQSIANSSAQQKSSDIKARRARHPALSSLVEAKRFSDIGEYSRKHQILRDLLTARPDEFWIDSDQGHTVGLTHMPTQFRIHMPKKALPPRPSIPAEIVAESPGDG